MQILLKPAKMPQQNRARVHLAAARAAAADTAARRTAKMRLPLRTAPNKKFSTGCGEKQGISRNADEGLRFFFARKSAPIHPDGSAFALWVIEKREISERRDLTAARA